MAGAGGKVNKERQGNKLQERKESKTGIEKLKSEEI